MKANEIKIPTGYSVLSKGALQKQGDLILTSGVFTPMQWKDIGARCIDTPYAGAQCGILVARKAN